MMEENPEMASRPCLTPMTEKENFELVWENGQLLTRDLSRKAQRNPSCNVHPSIKATFPQRRARFQTLGSILDNSYHDKKNFYMKFTHRNSLVDYNFHESLPEVYQTPFNVFVEQNQGESFDKFQQDSQVVPVHKYANLGTECHYDYFTETPQLAPTSQPDKSSIEQHQESSPFQRPRGELRQNIVSMNEFPVAKLLEQDSDSNGRRATTDFSILLGSPSLLQVNSQRSELPTRIPAPLSIAEDLNKNYNRSSPCSEIAPVNGLKTVKGFHYQPNLTESTVELLPPALKPSDNSLPHNESEAFCREDASPNKVYGQTSNIEANKAKGPVASSSFCSRGASNNPTYTLKRRYDDTEGSAGHPSQNIERKPKNVTKAVPGSKSKPTNLNKAVSDGKSNRKKLTTEFHNLSEKKRRDKINKKMRALRELIPNCNKVDKVSMLDEAIEYLKKLQLQVQMMRMGNRVCLPPMVFPNGLQQLQQMAHLSSMRMPMGVGCNPYPPPFLFPPIQGATAMPQLLPISTLPAHFGWGLLNTAVRLPGLSLASTPTQLMASKDSIHNSTSEERKNTAVEH